MIASIVGHLPRTIVAVIVGLLILASCDDSQLGPAGPAGAGIGEIAFLAAEHPHDIYWGGPATDSELLGVGRAICAYRASGLGDEQVLMEMVGGRAMLPPVGSDAHRMGLQRVRNAVRYLCHSG